MKKRNILMVCLSFLMAFSFAACSKDPVTPPTPPAVEPSSVTISQTSAALVLGGESLTLTAEVLYTNGAKNNKIDWSSSNPSIVKVENGVLTAVTTGTAVITAAATEKTSVSSSCTVEVITKPEISISNDALALIVGKGNIKLSIAVKHVNGSIDQKADWKSSTTSVATVGTDGTVTPVAVGTTDITATAVDGADTLTATCKITVLANATSLTNGTEKGLVYTITNTDSNANLGYSVKAENKKITALDIPSTYKGAQVTEIEAEAFKQCTEITSFSFGKNVRKIGANAFKLETEVIPDFENPVTKDHKALVSARLRTNLMLNVGTELAEEAFADSFFKIVTIPEGLTEIPYRAFAGSTITAVNLPTTLTKIKGYAFAGCRSLTSAILTHTKITSIGEAGGDAFGVGFSFLQCGTLTNVGTMPATLKTIEYSSFETCTNLATIVLNEGLEKIGNTAFRQCATIASISIPTTVTKIGENAFGQWSNAQKITTNIKQIEKPAGWHANWMGQNCDAEIIYKA